jgi:hypothetical protein
LVLPLTSVTRTEPSRAVCTTERLGSTASDIASPISALPRARVTCWKSAGLTAAWAAGAVVVTAIAAVAVVNMAAKNSRCHRRGDGDMLFLS